MAETVGVSRSSVSRQAIEGSTEQLKALRERHRDTVKILMIYIDGRRFGAPHIFSATGVDREGRKHALGIESGATENAASVKRLPTHLRDKGLPTDRKYLFVIDGAKALRAGIKEVFGAEQPVQRCRNHKIRNVLDELPDDQQGRTLNLMRAAWKVTTPEEGEKRLEQLSRFLKHDRESPAPSLREVGDPNWPVLGDPPRTSSPRVANCNPDWHLWTLQQGHFVVGLIQIAEQRTHNDKNSGISY